MTVYPDRLHVYLIAKAQFYGANTPIGHRCYNVVELLKNRRTAEGDQFANIDAGLALQLGEIEALCAAAMIEVRSTTQH